MEPCDNPVRSGKCVCLPVTRASSRPSGLCQKRGGNVYVDALLYASVVSFKILYVDEILFHKPLILFL